MKLKIKKTTASVTNGICVSSIIMFGVKTQKEIKEESARQIGGEPDDFKIKSILTEYTNIEIPDEIISEYGKEN